MDTRFEKILTGLMMLSAVGIIALLCFSGVRQTGEAAASSINDHPGIMRFHVIANSDSEKDQTLKLEVRDYVLQRVEAGITAAIASENNENGDQYSADAYDHQAAITRNYINENLPQIKTWKRQSLPPEPTMPSKCRPVCGTYPQSNMTICTFRRGIMKL